MQIDRRIKPYFGKLAGVVMVALAAMSCSTYSKLLKSEDHDKMYHKALEYYADKRYSRTITLLEEVAPYVSGSSKEDSVAYYFAASHYKTGSFEISSSLLNEFRKRYGRSPFLEDAEYMYAMGYYYSSPDPNRDQTATTQAIVAINEYLNRYPNSTKKEQLENNLKELYMKLEDKAALNAKVYYNTGQYKSAVVALDNALARYPDSPHREELSYLIVRSGYLLARNSIPRLQKDRYLNMMDYYYNFVSEFPDSEHKKELDKMLDEAKKYLAKHENPGEQPAEGSKEARQEEKKDVKERKKTDAEMKKEDKERQEQQEQKKLNKKEHIQKEDGSKKE